MKNLLLYIFAAFFCITTQNCKKQTSISPTIVDNTYAPEIIGVINQVTHNSVDVGITVTDGGLILSKKELWYGTIANPFNVGTKIDLNGNTQTISGLQPSTNYSIYLFAKNSKGEKGMLLNTKTSPAPATPPTVTTGTPSGITNTSITFSGNVTSDGGAQVTRGFVITWTNEVNGPGKDSVVVGTGVGNFSHTKANCIPGTKYRAVAFALNSAGSAKGLVDSTGVTTGVHVGSDLGYGIVIETYLNGDSALVVSKKDLKPGVGAPYWTVFPAGSPYPLLGASSDHDGLKNTLLIITKDPAQQNAAKLCYEDKTAGKIWYLPASDELKVVYLNRNLPGLQGTWHDTGLVGTYHSSTEYSGHANRQYYWGNNTQDWSPNGKGATCGVRAVCRIRIK